jgi:hypothetical protein
MYCHLISAGKLELRNVPPADTSNIHQSAGKGTLILLMRQ